MIYVTNLIKITDTKYLPTVENYDPFNPRTGYDETREELEQKGYFIDKTYQDILNMEYQFKINNAPPSPNCEVKRYFNPQINDFVFEYEEVNNPLEDAVNALGQSLAEEKIKNMQKDALISSLGQELTKVKLEIMQLKGGV